MGHISRHSFLHQSITKRSAELAPLMQLGLWLIAIRGSFLLDHGDSKTTKTTLKAAFLLTLLCLTSACEKPLHPSDSLEVAAKGIHAGALSSDGKLSLIGSIYHGGSLWNTATKERLFNWNHKQNESSTITVADFSADGAWALSASPYDLVLWNTSSGVSERFWSAPGEILDAELGPNANFALLGLSDHSAVIFNIRRGGILRTFAHGNRVRSVDLNRDGTLALTGSEDYTANLWDVTSGEKLKSLKHDDDVQLVKLSPDGSLALSVSKYDKALIWKTASGEALGEIPLGGEYLKRGLMFTTARFNDDASLLLTGRPDQMVELWSVALLSRVAHWKLPKRDAWKPTSAAVIDVGFGKEKGSAYAVASNGFIHALNY